MVMFINWGRYVAGKGPYPGHSKAVHPSESFHVAGVALDSDDWRIPRIVEILAENGFIRNRLHVPNENHHFEWLRNRDQNYGKPIGGSAASAGGSSTPDIEQLLEDAMANPIIDVDSTLWIARNDGTFEQYETWKAPNSRGIISKVFFGGKGGTDDKIPKLSAPDFEVAKTVWRQMCRGTAESVWSHKIPAQTADGQPVKPAVSYRADGYMASTNAIANEQRTKK
ncbi:hypothetical protein ACIP5T_03040 [Microbacterium sp. NPDC088619]|uniref:hypothetical protein n=1 Tax=Microbacterium sp. NPDC088619 TaxID=3364196 RepID=UPI0037FB3C6E